MGEPITGKIWADAAMIQRLAFAAGFYCTITAPKGLVHLQTALAMDVLFSFAAVAGYAAA